MDSSSPPLPITVRFTTSIPDLLLDIPDPAETTVVALKHLIRSKLDLPTSKHRFRFIHSGKLLKDDDTLLAVLKIPAPPPPRAPDPKGKGKAVDLPPPRVYINCSIGDVLTSAELSAETFAATTSTNKSRNAAKGDSNNGSSTGPTTTTTPTPRGFDRLLSGGFSPAEVNQLRLQFLSIQSNIHTPDTMPSPETLRRMEDAWIDDNAGNTGAGAANGGFDFGDDGLGGGALDDILWGNIMGFLWPLGSIGWIIRERGVWSRRRQIAVFTGFVLSLTFGMLRVVS
ncbi:DSC E3 ubiquitin ligase complex subunit [Lachnellula suecica]|uniref:DSC E3 ubiquitin ligase complex subunit n=1 Tax=Lachnellula suecica TaxID=602035 RepID=A0A8T9CDD8_9HELO|nr:DSC E3 ubiquitin ligase complex subunit [Lachnellula suecica]